MSTALALPETEQASLPTYGAVAAALERKTGSGLALVGWTFARAALIAPPILLLSKWEAPYWKKVLVGSLLSSAFISVFAVIRIYSAEYVSTKGYFSGHRWGRRRTRPPRGMKRIA